MAAWSCAHSSRAKVRGGVVRTPRGKVRGGVGGLELCPLLGIGPLLPSDEEGVEL